MWGFLKVLFELYLWIWILGLIASAIGLLVMNSWCQINYTSFKFPKDEDEYGWDIDSSKAISRLIYSPLDHVQLVVAAVVWLATGMLVADAALVFAIALGQHVLPGADPEIWKIMDSEAYANATFARCAAVSGVGGCICWWLTSRWMKQYIILYPGQVDFAYDFKAMAAGFRSREDYVLFTAWRLGDPSVCSSVEPEDAARWEKKVQWAASTASRKIMAIVGSYIKRRRWSRFTMQVKFSPPSAKSQTEEDSPVLEKAVSYIRRKNRL